MTIRSALQNAINGLFLNRDICILAVARDQVFNIMNRMNDLIDQTKVTAGEIRIGGANIDASEWT